MQTYVARSESIVTTRRVGMRDNRAVCAGSIEDDAVCARRTTIVQPALENRVLIPRGAGAVKRYVLVSI